MSTINTPVRKDNYANSTYALFDFVDAVVRLVKVILCLVFAKMRSTPISRKLPSLFYYKKVDHEVSIPPVVR